MRSNRTRYFACIVIVPALLLATWVAFKYRFEHRFAPRNMGYQGLLAHPETKILFVGSSHTRQSYDIRLIEQTIGKSSYLLSYNGLDMNEIQLLLRDWLSK